MNLRGAKADLEAAGEDTEGMANSTAELRDELLKLAGVDIMLNEDTFKSTFQILQEISGVWDSMADIDQAAALELMAGKRQANSLAAIIENFDTAVAARDVALDSSGSAWKENEAYLDSINGKIGQFEASFQGLSTTILDSDLVKWFIDLGTAITQAMQTLTEGLGGPGWLLGGALGAFASYQDAGIWSVIDDPDSFSGKKIQSIFSKLGGASDLERNQIKAYNDLLKAVGDNAKGAEGNLNRFLKAIDNTRLGQYINTLNGGAADIDVFNRSLQNTGVASRLAAAGMNIAAGAANMLAGAFVGFAINGLINGLIWLAEANDRVLESAQESNAVYSESISSLETYQEQVTELQNSLNSGTLGYEESKTAREQLLQIQQQMIEQFGHEAGAADLVTQAIQGQSEAWGELQKKQLEQWNLETSDPNIWGVTGQEQAVKNMEKSLSSSFDIGIGSRLYRNYMPQIQSVLDQFVSEYNDILDTPYGIWATGIPIAGPSAAEFDNLDIAAMRNRFVEIFNSVFSGASVEDSALKSLEEDAIDAFDSMMGGFQNSVDEKINEFGETYENLGLWNILENEDWSSALQSFQDQWDQYQNILASGETDSFTQAENSVRGSVSAIRDIIENGDTPNVVKDYLEGILGDAEPLMNEWHFGESLQRMMQRELHQLKGLDENDILDALLNDGDKTIAQAYEKIAALASDLGVIEVGTETDVSSVQKIVDLLVELGYVSGDTSTQVAELSTSFETVRASMEGVIEESNLVTSALSSQEYGATLSLDTYEQLIAANEGYADALEYSAGAIRLNSEKARQLLNEDIASQTLEAKIALREQAEEYRRNASAIEELENKISSASGANEEYVSVLRQQLASYYSAQDAIEGNINKYNILISTLEQATSAYQLWQDAQSTPNEGDAYFGLNAAIEDINDGLNTHRTDTDDYQTAAGLLVPQNVLDEGLEAVGNYVDNVLSEFIRLDEESGEVTYDGIQNFASRVQDLGYIVSDADGNMSMDLTSEQFQELADELNITTDLAEILFTVLNEFEGFDLEWDFNKEDLEATDEEVKAYINDLNEEIDGIHPLDFSANSDSIAEAKAKIYELTHIDVGMSEIPVNIKASLQLQNEEQDLRQQIDNIEAQIQQRLAEKEEEIGGTLTVEQMVEVTADLTDAKKDLQNQLDRNLQMQAVITPPTQEEINTALASIEDQKATIKAQIEATTDQTTIDSLNQQLSALSEVSTSITILADKSGFDADADAVRQTGAELEQDTKTVTIKGNNSDAIKKLNEVKNYRIPNKTSYIDIITRRSEQTTSTNKSSSSKKSNDKTSELNGTAHVAGNWGTERRERALVGEIGREIVVDPNTGKWHTVGDNGPEFVDLPKGSIIFNHEQTEEILRRGYVAGSGASYLNGNAYEGGRGLSGSWGNISSIGNPVGGNYRDPSSVSKDTLSSNSAIANSNKEVANSAKDAADEVEEYVSELWELYEVETKLADIQADTSILETQLDMAESANERIGIQEKILDQYKAEQDALHELANARRKLIQEDIATLRGQGFEIEYDPEYNNLFIKNTEHINDLIGSTTEETNELRQETEEMINTIIDMNDANQEAGDSWWQLAQSIKDAKDKLASEAISIFDDYIEHMDAFELWTSSSADRTDALIKKQEELNRLWEQGYLTLDQYKDLTFDNQTELYEQQRDALEEIIELTMDMIRQEKEDQIDALEEQIDAYNEIIDLRKEALSQAKAERDHQRDLDDMLREMVDLRHRIDVLTLAANSGDRAAEAERAQLLEQLRDLQNQLADEQYDYSVEQAQNALDKQQEAYEDQKNDEIDSLRDSLDDQLAIYKEAINRINTEWESLFDDLMNYTLHYGDIIDGPDSLKTAWENATKAVIEYGHNVEAALEGLKGDGSISNIMEDEAVSIVNQMRINGRKWNEATTPEEKAQYEAANERLAQRLSEVIGRNVVKDYSGYWHLDNTSGANLFDVYPGTLDADKINSLVDQMKANGSQWAGSSPAQRENLERANEQLAAQIQQLVGRNVIKGYDGEWYLDREGGTRLYDVWKGSSSSSPSTSVGQEMQENYVDTQVRSLVRDMKNNGTKWANATDDSERDYYAAQNQKLASQISQLLGRKVIIGNDGVWYLDRVGGRRLYDIYHKGGIVGQAKTLKDNEMFAVLEKGEFVLSDSQKKNLFDLIGLNQKLSIVSNNAPSTSIPSASTYGGDTFQADFEVNFNVREGMSESTMKKYGDMFADVAIRKLQNGFAQFGITPTKHSAGKR